MLRYLKEKKRERKFDHNSNILLFATQILTLYLFILTFYLNMWTFPFIVLTFYLNFFTLPDKKK